MVQQALMVVDPGKDSEKNMQKTSNFDSPF